MARRVFITGGTGYIGGALIPLVTATRAQRQNTCAQRVQGKNKTRVRICVGDALDVESYQAKVAGCDTFVHLVGVPHPSPAKEREFVSIDGKSAQEAIRVAAQAGVDHFVYLSVAHPAPVMHAYIKVRAECEASLRASGLNATIVRPWYVLGPGHRWPHLLKPLYHAAEFIPSLRERARRLGLVSRQVMVGSLAAAVEAPPNGVRVIEVPEIRRLGNGWQREHRNVCLSS